MEKLSSMVVEHKGLRFNEGKVRHDLIDPWATDQLARVFTFGAQKYAPNNWRKGMSWSNVIASLKRHLNAIERGEDFDHESGLLHAAHVQWNAHVLNAYYKIYPQGDDRQYDYLSEPRIALDIDEVIADFVGAWRQEFGMELPESWFFDYEIKNRFDSMRDNGDLDTFYMNIKPKIKPSDIPFDPIGYVTSRPVDTEITKMWLEKHGFPLVPVHTVGVGQSKVEVLKNIGADIFVDDCWNNFTQLNKAGICTFLLTASHNVKFNVGHKRINSLKDLV